MSWQKTKIIIPKGFGPLERQAIAQDVIDFIINRSRNKGLDKNNERFKPYSQSYKESLNFKIAGKSSKVDLTLSGEMLDELRLINQKSGELVVGYDKGNQELNGKVEGNRLGTYGTGRPDSKKARDFLGIHPDDLRKILDKYRQADDSKELARDNLSVASKAGSIVDGINFDEDALP